VNVVRLANKRHLFSNERQVVPMQQRQGDKPRVDASEAVSLEKSGVLVVRVAAGCL
jgi:hypothetical protein